MSDHHGERMKAVVYDRYGPPDVLRVEQGPVPTPGAGQVLVEVEATSVNLSDWEGLRGVPLYARIGGLRSPARRILGSDIAGRVAALGPGVTRFGVGDEVHGDNLGLMGGSMASAWWMSPRARCTRQSRGSNAMASLPPAWCGHPPGLRASTTT